MYGEYKHMAGAFMTSVELDHRNRAHQEVLAELEGEFPVVDPSLIGRKYRYVLCVGRSSTRSTDLPGYDDLVCFDADHGATERFSYGKDWLVEEHALVPDMSNPLGAAQWVVGTALDINRKQTAISVFRASSVSDGPVAQALLPFALPLGLHGCYVPAF
jgi:carotenoid cleavage dioxygenase